MGPHLTRDPSSGMARRSGRQDSGGSSSSSGMSWLAWLYSSRFFSLHRWVCDRRILLKDSRREFVRDLLEGRRRGASSATSGWFTVALVRTTRWHLVSKITKPNAVPGRCVRQLVALRPLQEQHLFVHYQLQKYTRLTSCLNSAAATAFSKQTHFTLINAVAVAVLPAVTRPQAKETARLVMAEGGSTCAREGAGGHLQDMLGLEPPRVLELAGPAG